MGFGFGQGQRAAMRALAAEADLGDVFGPPPPEIAPVARAAGARSPRIMRQGLPKFRPSLLRPMLRLMGMLAISALFVFLLAQRLADVDVSATWAAIGHVPPAAWAAALALTAGAFWAVGQYDAVLHRHFETGVAARAARRAGTCAIAVSQTIGLGVVTGAILRWRMLPDQSFWLASRLTVAVALSFLAGWAVVTSAAVVVLGMGGFSGWAWAVLGAAGLAVALCLYAPPAPFRWPNLGTISALVMLCAVDTLAAGCALYVLIPADLGLSLAALLPAFLLAYGAGLLSGTPGGIGAFELSLLALLPDVPEAPLLTAVLCWRLAYFVAPALIGAAVAMRGPRADADDAAADTAADTAAGTAADGAAKTALASARLLRDTQSCPWAVTARKPAEYGLLAQGEHRFLSAIGSGWMVAPRGHVLVAMLDPILHPNSPCAAAKLLDVLAHHAKATARMPALYKVSARHAARARASGWRAIRIAREAVLTPACFDLALPARAALRRKLRRAEAAGVVVEHLGQDQLPMATLAQIAQNWARLHGGERGFSMGRFAEPYIRQQRVYVARVGGVILGFVTFHTSAREWALDLMRAQAGLPDGAMHALVIAALRDAASSGVARLSLAAAPESAFAAAGGGAGRALRHLAPLLRGLRLDTGQGLRQFKDSFAPHWQGRYLCARSRLALLAAAASIARAVAFPRKLPNLPQDNAKTEPICDNRFALPVAIWHGKTKISAN